MRLVAAVIFASFFWAGMVSAFVPGEVDRLAEVSVNRHFEEAVSVLSKIVAVPTVNQEGMDNHRNPHFEEMTRYFASLCKELGFEFHDHGDVLVIALGSGPDRLGIVTHADVQPADPRKWKANPFSLDRSSKPGYLVGRGVEDDKGSIAAILFALKTLAEEQVTLKKRVEIMISYTEESDWDPFREFLKENPPPEINVVLDADYPVTVAEKAWFAFKVAISEPNTPLLKTEPRILELTGGIFLTQVPETAVALIEEVDRDLEMRLRKKAAADGEASFVIHRDRSRLRIRARGVAVHASQPEEGVNALTHLARLLDGETWQMDREGIAVAFINDLIGTGYYAEKFGDLGFHHELMGPTTLNLGYAVEKNARLELGINLRVPAGRTSEQVVADIEAIVGAWSETYPGIVEIVEMEPGESMYRPNAPQVPVLLEIFEHFTGIPEPKPVSIGGSSHAKLLPNAVNFGPAMPNRLYTGHSENEFVSEAQFKLNLRMYTAMLYMLAGPGSGETVSPVSAGNE